MSLFESIISSLVGVEGNTSVEHPCSNCPSDCALAPDKCSVCKPYKEKLVDAIYRVEHADEIRAKYVVSDVVTSTTTSTKCPYCNAVSSSDVSCDYCGSPLGGTASPNSDKIVVASANDIPNPILEAQDLIYARYAAVKGGTSSSSSDGDFLSQVMSFLSEEVSSDSSLGAKMTEAEIKEVASSYRVSVADYLTGLDNGRYLTLQGKKSVAQASRDKQQTIPSNATVPGLAGIGVGSLLGTLASGNTDSWTKSNSTGNWSYRGNNSSTSRSDFGGRGGMGGPGGNRGGMGGPGGGPGGGMGGRGGMGGPGGGMGRGGMGGPSGSRGGMGRR